MVTQPSAAESAAPRASATSEAFERWPRRGDPAVFPGHRGGIRGEDDLGLGILGDCPRCPGERAPKEIDPIRHRLPLPSEPRTMQVRMGCEL